MAGKNDKAILEKIIKGKYSFSSAEWDYITPEAV